MSKEKNLIKWVEKISAKALAVLGLKVKLNICLEPVGNRFATLDNACEVTDDTLYVNQDWLWQQSLLGDETEVRLLIYHEMRHIYQREEVKKRQLAQPLKEPLPLVLKWEYELTHYQRNEGGVSTAKYYQQSIEIDAYAFAICLLNMDVEMGEKLSLNTSSIPDEIDRAVLHRVREIYRDLNRNV